MRDPNQRDEISSLLDRVRDDAKALQRKAGKEDQETLEEYFTVVRETEQRLEKMTPVSGPNGVDFSSLKRPEGAARPQRAGRSDARRHGDGSLDRLDPLYQLHARQ